MPTSGPPYERQPEQGAQPETDSFEKDEPMAIEARIRRFVDMSNATPQDWIWETLAVLEADGRVARLRAQPDSAGKVERLEMQGPTESVYDALKRNYAELQVAREEIARLKGPLACSLGDE